MALGIQRRPIDGSHRECFGWDAGTEWTALSFGDRLIYRAIKTLTLVLMRLEIARHGHVAPVPLGPGGKPLPPPA